MRVLSFTLCAGLVALASCTSGGPQNASPQVLNSPAFVEVGDRVFGVLVSEVAGITKRGNCNCPLYSPADEDTGKKDAEKLAQDAGQRSKPISAGHMRINPGQTYEQLSVNSNCTPSSVSWGCRAKNLGVSTDLPRGFTIADTRYLKQFDAHLTVGGEKLYDQLATIDPIERTPKIACDESSKFCTAAVSLSSRLIAIWPVWSNDRRFETKELVAARQGRAILAVVEGS